MQVKPVQSRAEAMAAWEAARIELEAIEAMPDKVRLTQELGKHLAMVAATYPEVGQEAFRRALRRISEYPNRATWLQLDFDCWMHQFKDATYTYPQRLMPSTDGGELNYREHPDGRLSVEVVEDWYADSKPEDFGPVGYMLDEALPLPKDSLCSYHERPWRYIFKQKAGR